MQKVKNRLAKKRNKDKWGKVELKSWQQKTQMKNNNDNKWERKNKSKKQKSKIYHSSPNLNLRTTCPIVPSSHPPVINILLHHLLFSHLNIPADSISTTQHLSYPSALPFINCPIPPPTCHQHSTYTLSTHLPAAFPFHLSPFHPTWTNPRWPWAGVAARRRNSDEARGPLPYRWGTEWTAWGSLKGI